MPKREVCSGLGIPPNRNVEPVRARSVSKTCLRLRMCRKQGPAAEGWLDLISGGAFHYWRFSSRPNRPCMQ